MSKKTQIVAQTITATETPATETPIATETSPASKEISAPEGVSFELQVTGNMTLMGSHGMNPVAKARFVHPAPGKVSQFVKILLDPETGEQVVLKGTVRVSGSDENGNPLPGRKQSLTASFAVRLANPRMFITEAKEAKKSPDKTKQMEDHLLGLLA